MTVLPGEPSLTIDIHQLQKAAHVYRAINHPLRRRILSLLHNSRKMNVTDIYNKLQIEQSVASQHLAILRNPQIVATQRDGRTIWYSVNYDRLNELHEIAEKMVVK